MGIINTEIYDKIKMSLPCAAEVLTIKIDQMVPLPLHHRIRLDIVFKEENLHSSRYSNEELLSKSEEQLRAIFIDFKRYFEENFSAKDSDENINGFEEDLSNAASYLFIRPLELRMFLSGHQDLEKIIKSTIDRHSSLVDLSTKVLNRDYGNFADYLDGLNMTGIDEDSYLWWVSSLSRTIRDYIFVGIYCSFA